MMGGMGGYREGEGGIKREERGVKGGMGEREGSWWVDKWIDARDYVFL